MNVITLFLQTMAGLPTPNLLSESLNMIDPLDFDGDELPAQFKSSPMHVQRSQEQQNTSAAAMDLSQTQNANVSGLDLSHSLNSSQVDTSGLLLQHINTQKEVRPYQFISLFLIKNAGTQETFLGLFTRGAKL